MLGDNFRDLDELDQGIKKTLRLVGDKTFGVDFLLPATMADVGTKSNLEVYAELERDYPNHIAFVKELIREHTLPEVEVPELRPMSVAEIQRKIEVVLDNKVPLFAAVLGDPAIMTERAHALGMKVIGMAGAVRHAQRQVAAGVDIVVAQGAEAGGHTGNITTFILVPQVVDAVKPYPVLAAGGIGTGRHVAASLALGAQGVWVGTAFLVADGSRIPDVQKDQILGARSEQFTLSKYSSGKQQRAYHNPIREAWSRSGLEPLPMPLQGILTEPLSEAIRQAGRWDLQGIPSGQIGGMMTQHRSGREIFMDLVNEAEETIERLQHTS